jgi:hypothetical protein
MRFSLRTSHEIELQARIGIAERRRPDFVLFVPLTYWNYKWYAIQLDAAHHAGFQEKDELRDAEIGVHRYRWSVLDQNPRRITQHS